MKVSKELIQLSGDATPGTWFLSESGFSKRPTPTVYAVGDELRYLAFCNDKCNIKPTNNLANAEFICACVNLVRRAIENTEVQP